MAKLTLTDVTNITTSASTLNANFAAIEAAFEDILSRSGEAPNQLEANVDANSYRVYNLAPGIAENDAATVGQLAGSTPIGTGLAFTETAVTTGTHVVTVGTTNVWFYNTGAAGAVAIELCPAVDEAEFIIERVAAYGISVFPGAGTTILGGASEQRINLLSTGVVRLKCRAAGVWTIIADSALYEFTP